MLPATARCRNRVSVRAIRAQATTGFRDRRRSAQWGGDVNGGRGRGE
jgi:hypothetical protein